MKISKIKIDRTWAVPLWAVITMLMFSLPAMGQDYRDRDRRDRNDRRDRDRDLEREKWKQKFDLQDYLNKLDSDKSGVLDSKELGSERTRQFLSKMGIDSGNPVKIDTAVKKAKARYADKRDAERKKFESQVGPKLNTFEIETETIGVQGFGVTESKEPVVATFDESLTGLKMTDFEEKTLKDARKILGGYDRDKSGFLEGDEIGRVRWKDPKPSESDLNGDGRISLLEMAQRLKNKSTARAERSDRGDDRRDRDDDRDRGYDRGRRSEKGGNGRSSSYESGRSSSNSSSGNRSNSDGSKSAGYSAKGDSAFANYIDGVYKKYDTDGDKRLSQAELKKMRRPLKGDANSDGFLSKEEATNYIKKDKSKSKTAPKATASSTGPGSTDGRRRKPTSAGGRKYTPSKSRSSGGAKNGGALGDMDKNSDGQIQMSEFSKTWDEATLQKFRKTDADQDGILSADEWSSRSK